MVKSKENLSIIYLPHVTFISIGIGVLLVSFSIQQFFNSKLIWLGISPREWDGLLGILTAPLLHGNWSHLIGNLFPLMASSWLLMEFYPMVYAKVFVSVWLAGGLMVWLLARGGAYHIGASGVVYGITAFIFFSGFIRNDPKGIVASLILVFLYQGMLMGIFPLEKGISWEAHLYSALIGAVLAFMYRKINQNSQKKYDWEDEKQPSNGEWDYQKQLRLDQYDED